MAAEGSQRYYIQRMVAVLEEASRNYHRLARLARGVDPFVGEHTEGWETCDEEPCCQHRTLLDMGKLAFPFIFPE